MRKNSWIVCLFPIVSGLLCHGQPGGAYPLPIIPQTGGFVTVPSHSILVIRQPAMVLSELVLEDGATIMVAPGITDVQLSCQKLTLHGQSTLDLTPRIDLAHPDPSFAKPPQPPAQPQAAPRTTVSSGQGYQVDGAHGLKGTNGHDGLAGVDLTFNVATLDAGDGSLWIQNDGGDGFPGGVGGDGGKGSSGPHNCITNADGGNGGEGGTGGDGGRGGPVGRVKLTVAGGTIAPMQSGFGTPSARPVEATQPGSIVIFGNAGNPGMPGGGGAGGSGGEGHSGCLFSTDSKPGRNGYYGHPGIQPMPWTR